MAGSDAANRKRQAKVVESAFHRFVFPIGAMLDESLPRSSLQAALVAKRQGTQLVGQGSGFVLKCAGDYWFVTARHVVLEADADRLLPGNVGGLFAVVGEGKSCAVISLIGRLCFSHPRLDIAVFPLSAHEHSFAASSALPFDPTVVVDAVGWAAIGFPGTRNRQKQRAHPLDRFMLRLMLYSPLGRAPQGWEEDRGTVDFRWFRFHRERARGPSGAKLTSTSIRGMSGAPVLAADLVDAQLRWRLDGMLVEYHSAEATVVIVRLRAIVDFIEEGARHLSCYLARGI